MLLDLTIYGQHRLFHAVPLLFRFHQVHHADVDFDVTLGSRFHPIEMVLSMAIKLAVVVLLGASVAAVVLFETILAVTSLFNHSNVRLLRTLDRVLRLVLVTPAMHVVHHSIEPADRDRNFGFAIPWWDRMFGTYRDRSVEAVGMPEHRFQLRQSLRWMLALPFAPRTVERPAPSQSHRRAAQVGVTKCAAPPLIEVRRRHTHHAPTSRSPVPGTSLRPRPRRIPRRPR